MGYIRNPETGELEPQTKVVGTITTECGCRVIYDDANPEHRKVRLAVTRPMYVTCEHGLQTVRSAAYSGPVELLIPDPVERAEFEEEMRREKSGMYDEMYAEDLDDDNATPVC